MLKIAKILFLVLTCALVLASVTIEAPILERLSNGLSLSLYIRIASLLTLAALVLWGWGYKQSLTSSQKFARANQILSEAETAARRKDKASALLEERLKASYAEKEQGLEERIKAVQEEFRDQLNGMKKQNLELKNTVAQLMTALKKKKNPDQPEK
jgi:biopolymer transport protein ExbB/TolQ